MESKAVWPSPRYSRRLFQTMVVVGWCPVSSAAPGHCCIVKQMMHFYAKNVIGGFMELTFWRSGTFDACSAVHVKILHSDTS